MVFWNMVLGSWNMSSESFPKRDIAPPAGFFEGSAHFFVPPELFSRFRLADGVRGAEQIAEDANAVGVGEVGGEFDLRGKPLLFTKLASIHTDIIASIGVIGKECLNAGWLPNPGRPESPLAIPTILSGRDAFVRVLRAPSK